MVSGEIKRLIVSAHPRAGKSEGISRRLPAYWLGRNPNDSIISCSYSSGLASSMNRDVQRIMDDGPYHSLFPQTRLYGKNVRTTAYGSWMRNSDVFEVVEYKGSYRAAGVGTGVTGHGGNLILVDDYLRSAADARSKVTRDSQWEWFTQDLSTRQAPGCAIVIVATRWHHDDVIGRLLAENVDGWTVLRLPAIAEDVPAHPDDPRKPGEALWPERFGLAFLEPLRATMGVHAFGALYQQNPTPREGGMFKLAGLSHLVEARPAGGSREGIQRVRYWDKNYSALGDWTAGVLMSRSKEGLFAVEDVRRFRIGPDERNRLIKQTAVEDDSLFPGEWIRIGIEQPPGAGAETTARLVKMLAGHSVFAIKPQGAKEERAEPFAAQVEAGNVRLVRGAWNRAFVDELLTFPQGENDDQVDAASGAFLALVEPWGDWARPNPAARSEMAKVPKGVFADQGDEDEGSFPRVSPW